MKQIKRTHFSNFTDIDSADVRISLTEDRSLHQYRRCNSGLRQARTLDDKQIERVLAYITATSNSPASDELKVLLSIYSGLRACEIAGLTLDAVLNADDEIAGSITISRSIAKNGRPRVIPMHPRIRAALVKLRAAHPNVRFLAFSNHGKIKRQSPNAVKKWFGRLYREVGLKGCSSHSGRRTFITRMARLANLHGSSLRDVQLLAGHARLDCTARYIDPSEDLARLVAAFGAEPQASARTPKSPTNLKSNMKGAKP